MKEIQLIRPRALVLAAVIFFSAAIPAEAVTVDELKPKAMDGNAEAQLYLGIMYDNGQGAPEDNKEAVKWYRLSANQGNAFAQYNLGLMYETGEGVAKDDKEAVKK